MPSGEKPYSSGMVTEAQAHSILEIVADGESIKRAAELVGTTAPAVWNYRLKNPAFDVVLDKARREGMTALMDRVLDVTRACIDVDSTGRPVRPLPAVPPRLLSTAIDAAIRVAGKINPDKYGDRLNHVHTHKVDLLSVLRAADARLAAAEARRLGSVTVEGHSVRVKGDAGERALLGID